MIRPKNKSKSNFSKVICWNSFSNDYDDAYDLLTSYFDEPNSIRSAPTNAVNGLEVFSFKLLAETAQKQAEIIERIERLRMLWPEQ